MKTKYQIIDETVAAYNIDTLAFEGHGCQYETSDGRNCAVGRCIDPSKTDRRLLMGSAAAILNASTDETIALEDILLPEYKGHEISFWRDLQILHDGEIYWSETGLSEKGKEYVEEIKKKWEK